MKKLMSLMVVAALTSGVSLSVSAFEYDQAKLYVGGGLSSNKPDSSFLDSAMGYQFFAGYDLGEFVSLGDGIGFFAEAGYMTSGEFEACVTVPAFFGGGETCSGASADGLWSTAVVDYQVKEGIKVLGRAGFDFGDDDGLMFGGGVSYQYNEKIGIRGEYVIRQNYTSLQGNVVYAF